MEVGTAYEIRSAVRYKSITAWGLIRYHGDGMELVCVFTDFKSAEKARDAFIVMASEEHTTETFFVDELDIIPGVL